MLPNLFNCSGPDKGAGVNVTIPLRNRTAQSLQARALLEYSQAEMRLQQLYIQVRIQVINGQYALTNDRAALQAALAAREYNFRSYQAEVKKLATAENNVISTEATYAKDRASLEQLLANRPWINMGFSSLMRSAARYLRNLLSPASSLQRLHRKRMSLVSNSNCSIPSKCLRYRSCRRSQS